MSNLFGSPKASSSLASRLVILVAFIGLLTACDSGGTGDSNQAPNVTDDAYAVSSAETLTVPEGQGLLANDNDPEGERLTATLDSSPQNGTLSLSGDGSFEYTPDTGFTGAASFSYVAVDPQGGQAKASVTIVVESAPPVAQNDDYSTTEDETLIVDAASGVLANDSDPDGSSLTAQVKAEPTHGVLTLNSDGSFDYTPDTGFVGTDQFEYEAVDAGGYRSTAIASIDVHSRRQANVRFVHSSPDAGPVDVFLDDQEVAGDFPYRAPSGSDVSLATSDYYDVPVGRSVIIQIRDQEGNVVSTIDVDQVNLASNARYTIILAGAVAAETEAPEAILMRDVFQNLGVGEIGLRIVHGSALAQDAFSGGVDVYIADSGQSDLSSSTPLIVDLPFTQDTGRRSLGTAGAFFPREMSGGTQQSIYVAESGGTQPALEVAIGEEGLQISEGQYVTAVVADVPGGQGGLTVGAQAIVEDEPSSN
jgi:VCBS repeat-containing protein